MPWISMSDKTSIYYEDLGQGRPVVFVPGYSGSSEIWMYQILHLGRSFRCIVYDPRGHGKSDKPISDYTMPIMAKDLRELLEGLDVANPVLVGWSMGGAIAVEYALEYADVEALVLVAPTLPRFTQTTDHPFGMDDSEYDSFIERESTFTPEFRTTQFASNFYRSELRASAEWLTRLSLAMPPHVGVAYMNTLRELDYTDRLAEITCPTLICHSVNDRVCDPRWSELIEAAHSNVEVSWYRESGHALMLEEPEHLSEDIRDFVNRVDS